MQRLALIALVLVAACSVSGGPCEEGQRLQAAGEALFFGRGGCATCHKIGPKGTRVTGPNLAVGDDQKEPLARRARHPGHDGIRYVVESIVDPDAVTVPGYGKGVMPRLTEPPVALTDDEIVSLALYLYGGEASAEVLASARQELGCARVDREARAGK